jgi:hypothetical protein
MNSPNGGYPAQGPQGYPQPSPFDSGFGQMPQLTPPMGGGFTSFGGFGGFGFGGGQSPDVQYKINMSGADMNAMQNSPMGIATGAVQMATGVAGMIAQSVFQGRMIDLQRDYQTHQYQIAKDYLAAKENAMTIQAGILEGQNDLVRDLAEVQFELAKYQIDAQARVSIQNTKTKIWVDIIK